MPVRIIEYQSVTALKMSDHFPVRAAFEVTLHAFPMAAANDDRTKGRNIKGEGGDEQGLMGMLDDFLGVTRSQICAIS